MQPHFQKVLLALQKYISPVNARALLVRALEEHGLSADSSSRADMRRCSAALRRGVSLFVEPGRRREALLEVSEACGSDSLAPGRLCARDHRRVGHRQGARRSSPRW